MTTALCVPLSAAALIPILLGRWSLFAHVVAAQAEEREHPQITATGLRCIQTTDGKLSVELGLFNNTDRAVFVDTAKVDVVLGTYGP